MQELKGHIKIGLSCKTGIIFLSHDSHDQQDVTTGVNREEEDNRK